MLHWLPIVIFFSGKLWGKKCLQVYSIHTEIFLFPERFVSRDIETKDYITGKKSESKLETSKWSNCPGNFGSNVSLLLHMDLLKVHYLMGFLFKYFVINSFQLSYYWLVAI